MAKKAAKKNKKILTLGLPKGSLQESTLALFRKAGFAFSVSSRSYNVGSDDSEIRALLIRAQEIISQYPQTNRKDEIERILGEINIDLLYSGNIDEETGDKIYQIKRGDMLATIGRREKVSVELLKKINQIKDERRLNIGKRLKIPELDFSIVVDKTHNTLLLLNRGEFFKRYKVRTGRENWRTPTGDFRITYKKKNPDWNKPGEGTILAGDPENALGTRWMAFEGASLGIHGTNKPDTIGSYASEGCIGMLREDVEELFELVPVGTPVKITGKLKNRG